MDDRNSGRRRPGNPNLAALLAAVLEGGVSPELDPRRGRPPPEGVKVLSLADLLGDLPLPATRGSLEFEMLSAVLDGRAVSAERIKGAALYRVLSIATDKLDRQFDGGRLLLLIERTDWAGTFRAMAWEEGIRAHVTECGDVNCPASRSFERSELVTFLALASELWHKNGSVWERRPV